MFKLLDEVCKPTKGSKYSAAVDLYAREDIVIGAGETVKVPLGVCVDLGYLSDIIDKEKLDYKKFEQFMKSHYLQLEPRSSLRAKGLQAGTGIIDLDYKDEIMIILSNPVLKSYDWGENGSYHIEKGDKIAQIMLCEHKTYLMGIDTQEERTGGFGSTGK